MDEVLAKGSTLPEQIERVCMHRNDGKISMIKDSESNAS